MGKRLIVEPHLSIAELESHYRTVTDPIERTRYQIVWLLAKGFVTEEIASVTGYHPDRIRKIARRYNQIGPQGLIDARRTHPGRASILSDIEQAHLWQARLGVSR
jgi:transposase